MAFKVTMGYRDKAGEYHTLDLPGDKNLRLFDACDRADIYKRWRPDRVFTVVNEENGDFEYQV